MYRPVHFWVALRWAAGAAWDDWASGHKAPEQINLVLLLIKFPGRLSAPQRIMLITLVTILGKAFHNFLWCKCWLLNFVMPSGMENVRNLDLQRLGHQTYRTPLCVLKRLVFHSCQMRPYTLIETLLHLTTQLLVPAHQHNPFQLTALHPELCIKCVCYLRQVLAGVLMFI